MTPLLGLLHTRFAESKRNLAFASAVPRCCDWMLGANVCQHRCSVCTGTHTPTPLAKHFLCVADLWCRSTRRASSDRLCRRQKGRS